MAYLNQSGDNQVTKTRTVWNWSEPKLDTAVQEFGMAQTSLGLAHEFQALGEHEDDYAKQVGYALVCSLRAVESLRKLAAQHGWTEADLNPMGHHPQNVLTVNPTGKE
jgi:hypothetical protein